MDEGAIRKAFDAVPANRHFGFDLHRLGEDEAEVRMPIRAEHIQEVGVVHGGLLTALADTTAVYALLPGLPEGGSMTGIAIDMNFLRPALEDRGPLRARSRVVHRGRRTGVCEVAVLQEEREVARGTFTFLFLEEPATRRVEARGPSR